MYYMLDGYFVVDILSKREGWNNNGNGVFCYKRMTSCLFCNLASVQDTEGTECDHYLEKSQLFTITFEETKKRLKVDYYAMYPAISLDTSCVMDGNEVLVDDEINTRIHEDGWTISGFPIRDYFEWVDVFYATHPVHGRVWGNFGDEVSADSVEGFENFYLHHTPYFWDMADI